MAYSTVGSVRRALAPNLSDPDVQPTVPTNTAADLPDSDINDAIAEADALLDSFLGARYSVPVQTDPVPHPLDFWSRNIAAYNATLTLRGSLDFTDDDPVARRYNATMVNLTAVRDGKATLALDAAATNSPSAGGGADASIDPYTGTLFDGSETDLVNRREGYALDGNWYDRWGRAW